MNQIERYTPHPIYDAIAYAIKERFKHSKNKSEGKSKNKYEDGKSPL